MKQSIEPEINDLFVPFRIARELAEIGFKDECIAWFDPETKHFNVLGQENIDSWHTTFFHPAIVQAPMFAQVIDWFREIHQLHCFISRDAEMWMISIQDLSDENYDGVLEFELAGETHYREYQIVQIALIESAIKMIKSKEE